MMISASRTAQLSLVTLRRCLHSSARRSAEERTGRERCLNKVTLLGRVGNLEMRGKDSHHPVLVISLATNDYYIPKDSTEYVQTTEWHRVKIFNPNLRDSVYIYATPGSRMLVEGQMKYSSYTDVNTQVERWEAFVRADNVIFLSTSRERMSDE